MNYKLENKYKLYLIFIVIGLLIFIMLLFSKLKITNK